MQPSADEKRQQTDELASTPGWAPGFACSPATSMKTAKRSRAQASLSDAAMLEIWLIAFTS